MDENTVVTSSIDDPHIQQRKREGREFEELFWGPHKPDWKEFLAWAKFPPRVTFEAALKFTESAQATIPQWDPSRPTIGEAARLFERVVTKITYGKLMLLNTIGGPLDLYHQTDGIFLVNNPRVLVRFDLTIGRVDTPSVVMIRPSYLREKNIDRLAGQIAHMLQTQVNAKRVKKLQFQKERRMHGRGAELVGERV